MKVTIITDDSKSWFIPFGKKFEQILKTQDIEVEYVFDSSDISVGDICFILSCSKIISAEYLKLNKNNIVVHASDLPKGKGFSPLQWQILEGVNDVTLTLFEVEEKVDSGLFYFKDDVKFNGTELYPELREKLGNKIIEMCVFFIENKSKLSPKEQIGEETFYPRRTIKDDQLDIKKTIEEQFNHLRIADNQNNPLYFIRNGIKYYLKIEKAD